MRAATLPTLAALTAMSFGGCRSAPDAPPLVSLVTDVRVEPWRSPHQAGYALTSTHYQVFTTVSRRELRAHVAGFLEACHDNYGQITDLPDRHGAARMPVYLLATRGEWSALTGSVLGAGSAALNVEAGGFCREGIAVLWDVGGTATFTVLAHEGMHQFLHRRMRDTLPTWLEEGLCVLAEGHVLHGPQVRFDPAVNASRLASLQASLTSGRALAIEDLLATDPVREIQGMQVRAAEYYGQIWALMLMLRSREDRRRGLSRLLADAADGRLHQAVGVPAGALSQLARRRRDYDETVSPILLRHYLGSGPEGLAGEYAAFARKVARLE